MKKLFTLTTAVLILFTSACKKDSSKKEEPKVESSWTLDGTTYTTRYSASPETSTGDQLYLFWDAIPANNDQKFHTFNVTFAEAPTTSGTYTLVSVTKTPSAKQFTVSAGYGSVNDAGSPTGDSYAYVYFGDDVDVNVTVTGGKISVTLPEVSVKNVGTGPDVKLKASVKEL